MHWRLKALAFRALEIPGGDALHYFLQRRVTRTWPRPTHRLEAARNIARRVIDLYARHIGGKPHSVLEIGAGRDLAVPLALRSMGVERVVSTDIERLAKLDLVRHAARVLLNGEYEPTNWGNLESFGVYYRAPYRVIATERPVDCSCSNEVLEHIPADQLPELLSNLRAVTRGVTIHSIDYSDHYARDDGKLSRFHFLLYSDEEWRRYNPGRQYVSRLRHSDYLRLFREAGFEIIEETSTLGDLPPWIEVNVADRFRGYSRDDLRALKGLIIAKAT